jgi:hypothetical protein
MLCDSQVYFCNIQIKHLKHTFITTKHLKYMLATCIYFCCNICNATSRFTFATSTQNTWNIGLKHLKHSKHDASDGHSLPLVGNSGSQQARVRRKSRAMIRHRPRRRHRLMPPLPTDGQDGWGRRHRPPLPPLPRWARWIAASYGTGWWHRSEKRRIEMGEKGAEDRRSGRLAKHVWEDREEGGARGRRGLNCVWNVLERMERASSLPCCSMGRSIYFVRSTAGGSVRPSKRQVSNTTGGLKVYLDPLVSS